jgi:elongation factor P
MATTADIRNGLCIDHNGEPFKIIEFLHVKPGKGAAFVRTRMRNLNNGRVLENTFPSGAKLQEIRVETRTYQYLYNDADGYHVMNMDTFEQIALPKALINSPEFLKDGMEVLVLFHADEDRPLSCDLPPTVELEVTYSEPAVKGNTSTNAMKNATLETGAEIKVPLFIESGERIVVNTADGTYKERAKS